MKVNVEIDCTPLEARQFFGLPDVQPMQTAVMDKLQQQMMANIEKVSPEVADAELVHVRSEDRRAVSGHVRDHGGPRRHRARQRQEIAMPVDGSETPETSNGFGRRASFLLLAEARGMFEFNVSLLLSPLLMRAPRGDGHPVLTLPGFLASDLSMAPMRRYLKELGYDAHAWKMGRNLGGVAPMRGRAARPLAATFTPATGRKVSIVGWSLGGVYARDLALQAPDMVRSVDHARKSVRQRRQGDQRHAALRGAVGRGGRRQSGASGGDRRRSAGSDHLDLFPHRWHRELATPACCVPPIPPKTSRCTSPAISGSASTRPHCGRWPIVWRRPRANSGNLTDRDRLPLPMRPRKMHNPDQRPELRA